jgi:hypothetical protein
MRFGPAALLPALVMVAAAEDIDRKLKLEFDELSARTTAAVETVNSMEIRAKESGYSLNPDILAQRELLVSTMESAGEALRAKDAELLRKRLDRARGLVDRLFKML